MSSEVVYLFYSDKAAFVAPNKKIHKNAQDLRSCLLEFVGSNPISCNIIKLIIQLLILYYKKLQISLFTISSQRYFTIGFLKVYSIPSVNIKYDTLLIQFTNAISFNTHSTIFDTM